MKTKKILSAFCGLILGAGFLLPTAMTASAERAFDECLDNCRVYDISCVLDEEDTEKANRLIRETSDDLDMYFAVYLTGLETFEPYASDYSVELFADLQYNDLFNPDPDVDTDGVVLVINDGSKYDYMSTSGRGELYFCNSDSNDRCYNMLDEITPALKAGNYIGAIEEYCSQLRHYYKSGVPYNYYTYNDDTGLYMYLDDDGNLVHAKSRPYPWLAGIGISFVVSSIIALIVGLCIRSKYKFKKSLNPTNYICQNDSKFLESSDTFLRQYTTKTRIQSSSGGGGGGGGHSHSSGGHSHGGGGHHR